MENNLSNIHIDNLFQNPHVIININGEDVIQNQENLKKCQICYDQQINKNFIKMPHCLHEFCSSCVIGYLTQKILSNQIIEIKCPTECEQILSEDNILKILQKNSDLVKKYKKFKTMAKINQDPNQIWCATPDCEGHMTGDISHPKVFCEICKKSMCFKCKNTWHNLTCEEAMNNTFKAYIKKVKVKECPKCKVKFEKNSGCNHMTCTRCNFEFCWRCLQKMTPKHYMWFNLFGCPNVDSEQNIMSSFKNKFLLIIIVFSLILIGVPLVLVIALILSPFWIGFTIFFVYDWTFEWIQRKFKTKSLFVYVIAFIIITIVLPIPVILLICPGSCIGLVQLRNHPIFNPYYRQRIRIPEAIIIN